MGFPLCSNLKDAQQQQQLQLCRRAAAIEDGEALSFEDEEVAVANAGLPSERKRRAEEAEQIEDVAIGGGLKVPGEIWLKLYM